MPFGDTFLVVSGLNTQSSPTEFLNFLDQVLEFEADSLGWRIRDETVDTARHRFMMVDVDVDKFCL